MKYYSQTSGQLKNHLAFSKWIYFVIFICILSISFNFISVNYINNTAKYRSQTSSPEVLSSDSRARVLSAFAEPSIETPTIPDVDDVFNKVNAKRVQANLNPLVRNSVLTELANERARDMSANEYYSHINGQGLYFYDLLKSKNYSVGFACENLDLSYSSSEASYVADWMNSNAGHRECLLNEKITDAGYALVSYIPNSRTSDEQAYLVVAIHAEIK